MLEPPVRSGYRHSHPPNYERENTEEETEEKTKKKND